MRLRFISFACLLVVPAAWCEAQSAPSVWPDPNAREHVGWYELAAGHKALVTWAPDGAELRLLDFDSTRFHRLVPRADSAFEWRRGSDHPTRLLRFIRNRAGDVTGFSWSADGGDSGLAPRAREYPFDQQRITFRNDTVELAGVVLIPRIRKFVGPRGALREVAMTVPGAVVIHGSGAGDRDNVWAFHIAQHMARRDIAVLLPDKRGSGASTGDWRTADFSDLAADAVAGARALSAHAKVDADRVGFVGLSQGGWVAPLAASVAGAAFVVDVSGAAVTPAEQVRHELAQDLRRAGLADSSARRVLELLDRALDYSRFPSDSAWASYHSMREALRRGALADAVSPFPATRDHWQWRWWHGVADFDPVPHWRSHPGPALVVYGDLDEQDNVPVAESVRRLRRALAPERNPANVIRVFSGIGHTLVDPATRWISSEFLDFLSGWIIATSRY